MIISASYKTDIPTFYGEWFMNRLRAGWCMMVNPYNQRASPVDLSRGAVDGFVFWTRNIGPFLTSLSEIKERGYPFLVQYTITGYPRELEARVVDSPQAVESFKKVAETYGPRVPTWRYDPIVLSSLTPPDWHRENFARLAQSLEGATDEVVVSFVQTYRKTKRNVTSAAKASNFKWYETEKQPDESLQSLLADLATIARGFGMQLKVCSQKRFLVPGLIEEARCIDADRLASVAQEKPDQPIKLHGNRKECGCFASKDIGEYDTCPHGCVYCYAVQQREKALDRYKAHDPTSEFLFPPENITRASDEKTPLIPLPEKRRKIPEKRGKKPVPHRQIDLFPTVNETNP